MANTFTIGNFFKNKSDDAIEMMEFQGTKNRNLARDINNGLVSELPFIDGEFQTFFHEWTINRLRATTQAQSEVEKSFIKEILYTSEEQERKEKRKRLHKYRVEEREKKKKAQLDFLLYYAFKLEKLYLANGRPDLAKNIRSQIDMLKKKEFTEQQLSRFPENQPLPGSAMLEFLSRFEYYMGRFNLWRLSFVYGRIFFEDMLNLLKTIKIEDSHSPGKSLLEHIAENLVDLQGNLPIDAIEEAIKQSKFVGNIFSLLFFFGRLVTDLILIAMLFMEEAEVDPSIRFGSAFWSKFNNLVNDVVWTFFNFLTNFSDIVGIADSTTCTLLGIGLLFDIVWTMQAWYREWQEYEQKRAEYIAQLKLLKPGSLEYEMTMKCLKKTEIDWEANCNTNMYGLMGGVLLIISFLLPLIVAPFIAAPAISLPILKLVCDFIGILAIALYQTTEYFAVFMQKKRELAWFDDELKFNENGQLVKPREKSAPGFGSNENAMEKLLRAEQKELLTLEYEFARNNLLCNLALYVFAPAMLLSLSSVCFPAAIVGFAVFIMLAKFVIEPLWCGNPETGLLGWSGIQNDDLEAKTLAMLNKQDAQESADNDYYLGSGLDTVDQKLPEDDPLISLLDDDSDSAQINSLLISKDTFGR